MERKNTSFYEYPRPSQGLGSVSGHYQSLAISLCLLPCPRTHVLCNQRRKKELGSPGWEDDGDRQATGRWVGLLPCCPEAGHKGLQ